MLRDKPSAVNDGGIVKPIEDHLNSQNSGTKVSIMKRALPVFKHDLVLL